MGWSAMIFMLSTMRPRDRFYDNGDDQNGYLTATECPCRKLHDGNTCETEYYNHLVIGYV